LQCVRFAVAARNQLVDDRLAIAGRRFDRAFVESCACNPAG
jgi:hypothetical protein